MKHTEGKWYVWNYLVVSKETKGAICEMMPTKYEGCNDEEIKGIQANKEANAKLIAAAPEMLNHLIIIASRDGVQYLYDFIEEITGEKWNYEKLLKETRLIYEAKKATP